MDFNFKTIIEDYCETEKLTAEELDFLEREHLKTMTVISKALSPSIAHWNICDACNIKQVSFWISCNASILDRIRPVNNGKLRSYKLFDALCQFKLKKIKTY